METRGCRAIFLLFRSCFNRFYWEKMVDISTDPEFEYDAPTYIDFNLLQQGKMEDDNADAWFGE